ncbi:MAG: large conductance mechanosensitive channel protein MscL [Acidobacteria bacterium]|nr:large conductance mechanosensitive channel protein MscL [Acidobacteriota bacterium]
MFQAFKEFAMKGNVLDMAVGVIMGAAFGKIVSTFTEGIMMPPIGKVMGSVDFSNKFVNLSDTPVVSLAEAKAKAVPVITYGMLINNVIDFLIVAFVLFLVIQGFNKMKRDAPAPPPPGPTVDQKLLTEIRDLLASRKGANA